MKLLCVTPCVNQETGTRHQPGDVIEVGNVEGGRLMAFGHCGPCVETVREAPAVEAPERRRRGRKPKEEKRRYSGLAEYVH